MLTCQRAPQDTLRPGCKRKAGSLGHCVPRSGAAAPRDLRAQESQNGRGTTTCSNAEPKAQSHTAGAARLTEGVTYAAKSEMANLAGVGDGDNPTSEWLHRALCFGVNGPPKDMSTS